MPAIFINYRVLDAQDAARTLATELGNTIDADVWFDSRSLETGDQWDSEIRAALDAADCMIVVIGPRWLQQHDDFERRRLDLSDDWVRMEIEHGLGSESTHVVPVLVQDAREVPPEALPESIRSLAKLQYRELRRVDYDDHFSNLVEHLIDRCGFQRTNRDVAVSEGTNSSSHKNRWAALLDASAETVRREIEVNVGLKYIPGLYVKRGIEDSLSAFLERNRVAAPIRTCLREVQRSLATIGRTADEVAELLKRPTPEVLEPAIRAELSTLENAIADDFRSLVESVDSTLTDCNVDVLPPALVEHLKTAPSLIAPDGMRASDQLETLASLVDGLAARGAKRVSSMQMLLEEQFAGAEASRRQIVASARYCRRELNKWRPKEPTIELLDELLYRERTSYLEGANVPRILATALRSPSRSKFGELIEAFGETVDAIATRQDQWDQSAARLGDRALRNGLRYVARKKIDIRHPGQREENQRTARHEQLLWDALHFDRPETLEKLQSTDLYEATRARRASLEPLLEVTASIRRYRRKLDELLSSWNLWSRRCTLIVDRAGSGKTNLLSHLAIELSRQHPVVFATGRSLSTASEVTLEQLLKPLASGPESHDSVLELAETRDTDIVVVIDAINETSDIPRLDHALRRLIVEARDRRVVFVMSCRDVFWQFFDAANWHGILYEKIENRLYAFDDTEHEAAIKGYLERFNVSAVLTGDARNECRHPLLLRFFCEAYRGVPEMGEVAEIRLKHLFDHYWKRKTAQISEHMGARKSASAPGEALYAIAREMLKQKRKDLALTEVREACGFSEIDTPESIYQRILDEDIILEEDLDLHSFKKRISFVYEAFMEYVLSLALYDDLSLEDLDADDIRGQIVTVSEEAAEFGNLLGAIDFLLVELLTTRQIHGWSWLLSEDADARIRLSRSLRLVPVDAIDERSVDVIIDIVKAGQGGGSKEELVVAAAAATLRRFHSTVPQLVEAGFSALMDEPIPLTKKKCIWLAKYAEIPELLSQLSAFFASDYRIVEKQTFDVLEEAGLLDAAILEQCLDSRFEYVRSRARRALDELEEAQRNDASLRCCNDD